MTLYIDTSEYDKAIFALKSKGKLQKKIYKLKPQENFAILQKLEQFFKQFKILHPQSEIKKIIVNKGPGSFTGLRVGAAIALALGFAWNVPVKFASKDKFKIK